jgi:hypothetical protein
MITVPYRPREGDTYVRFVFFQLVDGQRSRMGLFQARQAAVDSLHSPAWALDLVRETFDWFDEHLDAPTHYDSGPRRGGNQPALCWFKAGAEDHIGKMYDLKTALDACGVLVDVITTRDPGHVVYEDKHQVAAQPGHRRF